MNLRCGMLVIAVLTVMVDIAWALSEDGRPEYKKEYDAYMQDLEVIAQTGRAPRNIKLEDDLAKMSSDAKILLTAPLNSQIPHINLAENDVEIINSVEIIRVPEEFRKHYADVYKEEAKTISAHSLVDVQDDMRKNAMIEDMTMKIADHINPFRFLKEVELSKLSGEYGKDDLPINPMVGAYFNQLGRPYVATTSNEANNVNNETTKKRSKPTATFPSLRNSMFVN